MGRRYQVQVSCLQVPLGWPGASLAAALRQTEKLIRFEVGTGLESGVGVAPTEQQQFIPAQVRVFAWTLRRITTRNKVDGTRIHR